MASDFLAFRQLELVGLKVGDTIFEPSIQRDAVIRMQFNGTVLKPGTLIPKFSVIDLVIGAGPKRNIIIPNLVGLTVQEAKAIISQNLFEVGLIEHEDRSRDESDIVYYQDPESNSIRDQGMQIDMWASKKTPAEMSGKISELNSMYRIKIDTTTPQINYYQTPEYYKPETVPKETKAEVKIKTVPSSKPKPEKTSETEKPKTTQNQTPVKPKAKKVVVE